MISRLGSRAPIVTRRLIQQSSPHLHSVTPRFSRQCSTTASELKGLYKDLSDLLDKKQSSQISFQTLKEQIKSYPQKKIIDLMKLATAPNYAGNFDIVVDQTDGPWWIDKNGYFHLNANTSYGAKRFPELVEANTGELPSRMVYSTNQLITTLIVNAYGINAGIEDPKSLVLMSGSDVMKAAYDGTERLYNDSPHHIIFKDHFHGRSEFNCWEYDSDYFKRRKITPLIFNNTQMLTNTINKLMNQTPQTGVSLYIEPVQGEGGVNPIDPQFEKGIMDMKQLYQDRLTIVVDGVQRGIAGDDLWGLSVIKPDMMALSKSVNMGNYPVGVLVGKSKIMDRAFPAGSHGGTGSLRDDGCQSIIAAFNVFTSTNALSKLQRDSEQLVSVLNQSGDLNKLFTIKSDNSSMIGIQCIDNKTVKMYQKKCSNCGIELNKEENKELKRALIDKYTESFSLEDRENIERRLNLVAGIPLKIAGDNRTLRVSGQMVNHKDEAMINILYSFCFNIPC